MFLIVSASKNVLSVNCCLGIGTKQPNLSTDKHAFNAP